MVSKAKKAKGGGPAAEPWHITMSRMLEGEGYQRVEGMWVKGLGGPSIEELLAGVPLPDLLRTWRNAIEDLLTAIVEKRTGDRHQIDLPTVDGFEARMLHSHCWQLADGTLELMRRAAGLRPAIPTPRMASLRAKFAEARAGGFDADEWRRTVSRARAEADRIEVAAAQPVDEDARSHRAADVMVLATTLVRPSKGRHNPKAVRAFAESNGVENVGVGQRRYVDQHHFEVAWRQVERAGSQHLERIEAAKREARRKKEAQRK